MRKQNDDLKDLLSNSQQKIQNIEQDLLSVSTRSNRDIETKNNKIRALQQIIKGIQNDIKRALQPREASPIETEISLGFLGGIEA